MQLAPGGELAYDSAPTKATASRGPRRNAITLFSAGSQFDTK
jgi:hypothetical protein